ncbi:conserved hypothetical protein [Pediculus humanus corporis]|uniref:CWH43-like N-terminal domain-containing protein n=1 Tax=Pediculus humanus subsp. corporis TaxID=121224 RepID=E0VJN5_PEDHC|nr:uncharacterized protein Phum_PHUM248240 [Pediculus humanus corporis]EEB13591.1 conserved hypothetical protein [Pediculus humanus corporis]
MVVASILLMSTLLIFFFSTVVTYTISVITNHVKPFIPNISYTGNEPVESCIFTASLNIVGLLYVIIVYVRYCQYLEEGVIDKYSKNLQKLTFLFGLMGAFGLSIIASFSQKLCLMVHSVGFLMCFSGTFLYILFQTLFSFGSMSKVTPERIKLCRLIVFIIECIIHFIGTSLCFAIVVTYDFSSRKENVTTTDNNLPKKLRNDWLVNLGAGVEWLTLIVNLTFFGLFYGDFKRIIIKSDEIIFLPFTK